MNTRTLARWMLSIGLTLVALIAINLLLVKAPTQARRAAALINCSGSIQACINAADVGDTVLIAAGRYTESLTLSKPVSLTGENRDTTIIHAVAYQRVLTVTGAAISNSVVISGLTFTGGTADYGGGALITNTAQPLIRASSFISNMASIDGGGVYAQSDLMLMDSRIISNVAANQGGGLYALGPNLVLTNSDFIGNVGGGTIVGDWDHLSQVNVNAGSFINNTDAGLSVYGSLNMNGTQVLSNTGIAFLYGAGVGIYQGTATIVNSRFESNYCDVSYCDAGGLSFYRGIVPSLVISNSVFIGNTPGGVYVHDYGQVTVTNSLFERNTNTENGGGMTLWQSSLTVIGSKFISNAGGVWGGGGIQIFGTLTLVNSRFEGNSDTSAGGGIYVMGNAYLADTQFISNTADSEGGAAFVGGTAYVTDSRFERNTAGGGGGLSGGSFFVTRTQFLNNTGTIVGGGIMAIGPLVANNSQFIGNQCLDVGCAGGGLYLLGYGGSGEFVNTVFARNQGHGTAMFVNAGDQISLRQVTVADTDRNPQPAIAVLSGTLYLTNTIIASHTIAISNTGGTVNEDYNLFFDNITNTLGVTSGGHSLIGDPQFVDPLHGNYHLQFGSDAIDHGVDAGVYTDLDGHPRPVGAGFDIGAYEFSGGPRYVATTGDDTSNDCTNSGLPCATVQHAIDVANDGEQILIASGLYTQSATLNKPVSLTGENRDTTILHAMAGQRVLTVTGATISNSVVISGLTFTGGVVNHGGTTCPYECGGGMLITDRAKVTIRNVNFFNNTAAGAGGGLYDGDYDTAVILLASQFISNTAGDYGGGAASDGSITLIGGQFISNTSQGDGGGLGTDQYHAPVLMTGTHFINNATNGSYGSGGGATVFGTVIITGGYFEGNVSHGLHGGGLWANELIITNTDFVSNTLVGSYWGGGVSASIATIFGGHFERNSSGHNGGGLSVDFASISGTQFISNTSNAQGGEGGGGGAFVVFQSEIRNARFEGNRCIAAECTGGGMLLWGQSRIANTLLSNNTANDSGAAIATDAFSYHPAYRHELQHLTIASSTFITKPAIVIYSGTVGITDTIIASYAIAISNTSGTVYEDYNLFFNNITNTLGVISDGGHSLIGDPQFIDPLHGDYHLQPGSAAIDHGVDAGVYTDLDGHPRPYGAGFDIGAYEYQGIRYLWLPLIRKSD